ncbi:MAG: hypothetical protein GF353_04195 [Candidatus Lokiarchaeota archaeon]|nr:hypothetical protein [Candidatus Lokiarchaeota archaeon]
MKNIENRILITNLDAITLLSIGSPENYEKIIEEWAKSYLKEKCGKYLRVEKLGGAGDKGRDIVCTINDKSDEWDNYQCKHYHKPISPSMVWVEFAKLIYYVFIGDYSTPVNYYFVSPLGVGAKFRDLLKTPDEIKKGLIANWDKYCKEKVTSIKIIELDDTLISFIDDFDFSIFDYISPSDFIDQFKLTPYYTQRFGRLYKPRPLTECPDEIEPFEMEYIKKILQAYSDYLNEHVDKYEQLNKRIQPVNPCLN